MMVVNARLQSKEIIAERRHTKLDLQPNKFRLSPPFAKSFMLQTTMTSAMEFTLIFYANAHMIENYIGDIFNLV